MALVHDLLKVISEAYESSLDEASAVKVKSFAGGKAHIKLVCPPGFKQADGKCSKMDSKEIASRRKGAKLAARKRKGKMGLINKMRAKSMQKRTSAGL